MTPVDRRTPQIVAITDRSWSMVLRRPLFGVGGRSGHLSSLPFLVHRPGSQLHSLNVCHSCTGTVSGVVS